MDPLVLIGALVFMTVLTGILVLFRRSPDQALIATRLEAVGVQSMQGLPRDAALAVPFSRRVLVPSLASVWTVLRGLVPAASLPVVRANLAKAGRRYDDPAVWVVKKWLRMLLLGLAGAGLAVLEHRPTLQIAGFGIVGVFFGYISVELGLKGAIRRRQDRIVRSMPETLDLLTITVEAGLGLDQALEAVTRRMRGPLPDEIQMYLNEVSLGQDRLSALRAIGTRTDVLDLRAFTSTLAQAMEFGVSIAGVLRAQSEDARIRHRLRIEERAQKAPVKLLFPLIFLILPALFVAVAGPAFIRFGSQFTLVSPPAAPGR